MGSEIGATAFDPSRYVIVGMQDPVLVFTDHSSLEAIQPDRPARIKLSPMDQLPYMYIILSYKSQSLRDTGAVVREMKTALQQALAIYFPLAGRLKRSGDNTGYLEIDCSNEGVLLVEACASVKDEELDSLHGVNTFDAKSVEKFVYQLAPTEHNPLLSIQITQLSRGGFVLGVGWRHEICDGFGFYCFLQAWADIARGKPLSRIPLPYYSRELLQPKPHSRTITTNWQNHLEPFYESFLTYYSLEEELRHNSIAVTDTPSFTSSPDQYITKIFPISQAMISTLKKKAMEGESAISRCTTFEVVISYAWLARVKAFENQAHENVFLSFAVNARTRTDPPLPEYYVGNACVMATMKYRVDDLLRGPFHAIVEEVQRAKAKVGGNYIEHMIAFIVDDATKALVSSYREPGRFPNKNNFLNVTEWTKFAFEKLDFGLEAASFMAPVAAPVNNVMCILRTRWNEGGVSLFVELPAAVMLKFEKQIYEIS